MKALHLLNALSWFVNALLWIAYAHSLPLGLMSGAICVTALFLARREPDYYSWG
jgi:hypothetical protein